MPPRTTVPPAIPKPPAAKLPPPSHANVAFVSAAPCKVPIAVPVDATAKPPKLTEPYVPIANKTLLLTDFAPAFVKSDKVIPFIFCSFIFPLSGLKFSSSLTPISLKLTFFKLL